MIPFDRTLLNEFDRFHSGGAAIGRTPRTRDRSAHLEDVVANKLVAHGRQLPARRRRAGRPTLFVAALASDHDNQREAIAFLEGRESYGMAVSPFERIDTHAEWSSLPGNAPTS